MIKITPEGFVTRKQVFNTGWIGGGSNTYDSTVKIDSSDNIYIAGTWDSSPKQMLLVKLDSSGNLVWQNRVGSTSLNSECYCLSLDASENPIVFGSQVESGAGSYQFILKETTAGAVSWGRKRGGTTADYSLSGATDSSSNVYVGGRVETGTAYASLMQYSSSGTLN